MGHRRSSDPMLLWPWYWCRLLATAPIQSVAWELPYAKDAALKRKKKMLFPNGHILRSWGIRSLTWDFGEDRSQPIRDLKAVLRVSLGINQAGVNSLLCFPVHTWLRRWLWGSGVAGTVRNGLRACQAVAIPHLVLGSFPLALQRINRSSSTFSSDLVSPGFCFVPVWSLQKKYTEKSNSPCLCSIPWSQLLFSFFLFLGPHPWHMEVPRLEAEYLKQSCSCLPTPQPHRIQAGSAAYTTAHSNTSPSTSKARDGTRILMHTSWVLNLLRHSGNSVIFIFVYSISEEFCPPYLVLQKCHLLYKLSKSCF